MGFLISQEVGTHQKRAAHIRSVQRTSEGLVKVGRGKFVEDLGF